MRALILAGLYMVMAFALSEDASARPYPFVMVVPPELQTYFLSVSPPREVPYELRRKNWSGRGVFRANMDANGKVTAATVIKTTGYPLADEALLGAIRKWRGKPGRKREIDFPLSVVAPPRGMPAPGL